MHCSISSAIFTLIWGTKLIKMNTKPSSLCGIKVWSIKEQLRIKKKVNYYIPGSVD